MRKLISMMLMLCAIVTFSACSSDDDGPTNPITNAVVPSSAKIGSEVTVQGSGFATGQTILLQPESGDAVDANAKMSSNGATFTIPYTLSAGKVNVVLKSGNDSWTLGSINLLDADNPISALSLPSEMAQGKEITISGIGFAEGDKILLASPSTKSNLIQNPYISGTVTSDGLKFTLPNYNGEGMADVKLVRGNSSWSLGEAYIYQPRQIESITISGNTMVSMYAGMIGLTEDDLVLNLAYNDNVMLSAITSNATNVAWQLKYDGKKVTCDNYTFTLDDQNRVVSSTRQDPDYTTGEYVESKYVWSYDANGYLVSVKKEGAESDDNNFVASYADGNLGGYTMSFTNELATANKNLRVCPETVEPAFLINTFAWLMQRDDLFLGFLINQNVKVSAYVPTQFIAGDIDPSTGADIQTKADMTSSFKDNVLTLQTTGAAIAASQLYYANTVSVKYKNK